MKRRSVLGLGVSLALLQTGCATDPASLAWEKDFDAFMHNGLARTETPGMSVAVVRGEQTIFARGYGWADIAAGKKADAGTVFHVASVSKLVTATAIMMLLEQGAFQLDDKVAAYLDFPLLHPKFPDVPITFRHLLSHTSGISDAVYDKTAAFAVQGDPRLPLRDFVKGYLSRGGAWYDADVSFAARPGTEWRYSNVGIALLGYLVGRLNPDGPTRHALRRSRTTLARSAGPDRSGAGPAPAAAHRRVADLVEQQGSATAHHAGLVRPARGFDRSGRGDARS